MNITAESYGHAVMLNPKGELTEDTLASFKQAVEHHLGDEGVVDIVINFEGVTFVDSASLEYLLELQEKLAAKFGQVRLVKPDENVHKILEITRLDSVFEVFQNVADVVKAVQV